VQTRLNRSWCCLGCGLAWPKASRVTWEVQIPHRKGQFWWIGAPIVKHRHFLPYAVQKRLNRSICRFGCGLEWAEECTSSIVFARWRQYALLGGHVAVTCRTSVYCGDASYIKLLRPLVIFGHAHLDSRTSHIVKRFELSTVLWAFHTIQPSSLFCVFISGRCIVFCHCFVVNNDFQKVMEAYVETRLMNSKG